MKIKVVETVTEIEATAEEIGSSQSIGGRIATLLANALTPYKTYDDAEESSEELERETDGD